MNCFLQSERFTTKYESIKYLARIAGNFHYCSITTSVFFCLDYNIVDTPVKIGYNHVN